MAAQIELTGGNFQDSEGNLLALGYIEMRLSQDGSVNDSQVCSGIVITITLDSNGDCDTGQYVWGNDALAPANSFYKVTVYSAEGQIVWGPNNQQVTGSGTFDVGSWSPNQVISWVPPLQVPQVEVNGTDLSSSSTIDFVDTATVTWEDAGNGQLEATAITTGTPGFPLNTATYKSAIDSIVGPTFLSTDSVLSGGGTFAGNPILPFVMLTLVAPFTVHKISLCVQVDSASSHGLFAIYSADGQTKLVDAGANAFDTSSTGVKTVTLGSPVTLPAGNYLCSWSANPSSNTVRVCGYNGGSLLTGYVAVLNANAIRYGQSSTYYSGGVMPATLGTLTADPSNSFDMSGFFLE